MLGEGIEPATIEQAGSQAGYPAAPLQLSDELNLTLMQKIRQGDRGGRQARRRQDGRRPSPGASTSSTRWSSERSHGPSRRRPASTSTTRRQAHGIWPGLREHVQVRRDPGRSAPGPDRPDALRRGHRDAEVLRRGCPDDHAPTPTSARSSASASRPGPVASRQFVTGTRAARPASWRGPRSSPRSTASGSPRRRRSATDLRMHVR